MKRVAKVGVGLLVGALVVSFVIWAVPVRALVARSEGHIILIDEPNRKVDVPAGETTSILFRVTNVAPTEVTIVGAETGCGCTSVAPIPVTIPSLGHAELTFAFNMSGRKAGTSYVAEPRIFVSQPSPELKMFVELSLK